MFAAYIYNDGIIDHHFIVALWSIDHRANSELVAATNCPSNKTSVIMSPCDKTGGN